MDSLFFLNPQARGKGKVSRWEIAGGRDCNETKIFEGDEHVHQVGQW